MILSMVFASDAAGEEDWSARRKTALSTHDSPSARNFVSEHFRFVWRSLRRFGAPVEAVDDAAQQVFVTAVRKLDAIEPGKERAFLLGIAVRVAANARRKADRSLVSGGADPDLESHPDPHPEALLEWKRRRELLDEALGALPDHQRVVFVLFELEGLTCREIAESLEVPMGTVTSRLRRGRARFGEILGELRRREEGDPA